jgi:hypothetical protein
MKTTAKITCTVALYTRFGSKKICLFTAMKTMVYESGWTHCFKADKPCAVGGSVADPKKYFSNSDPKFFWDSDSDTDSDSTQVVNEIKIF